MNQIVLAQCDESFPTAWQDISRRLRDTIIRSFAKCGIALPISGQRDNEINLSGLENYTVGQSSDVEYIWFHDEDNGDE